MKSPRVLGENVESRKIDGCGPQNFEMKIGPRLALLRVVIALILVANEFTIALGGEFVPRPVALDIEFRRQEEPDIRFALGMGLLDVVGEIGAGFEGEEG